MQLLKSRKVFGNKTARAAQVELGQRRRLLGKLTALLTAFAFLLVVLSSSKPEAANAQAPIFAAQAPAVEAKDLIRQAWERAQASGTYKFTSDIVQTTMPLATAINAGRQSEVSTMYLEGNTNLRDQQLLLKLWNQGGNVIDESTAVQVRVEKDVAFIRQGNQAWQEVDDFTSFFAPNADFMSYLVAAKNISEIGTESRAGIEFTRFAFELDGLSYATYMRDQMEAQLHASGDLPAEMSLGLSQQYVDMTGTGELWITPDGWPLRQIINMVLPAENESQVSAEITVNFSDFDKTAVAAAATTPAALLNKQIAQLKTIDPVTPIVSLLSSAAVFAFIWLLLKSLRSRKVYAAINLTIIFAMLGTPWIRDANAHQFTKAQAVKAQEQEEKAQERDARKALANSGDETAVAMEERLAALAADDGTDTDNDGHTDVAESLMGTNPLSSPLFVETNQQQSAPPTDKTLNSDDDSLTDYVEYLVNTLPGNEDSDGDEIWDDDEVLGFTLPNESKVWYTNPLLGDTNGDGLSDTEEWGDTNSPDRPDTDGDKVPDLFDPDNDGDGVADAIDLSPYYYQPEQNRKIYTEDAPLDLVIDNLTPDEYAYVEIQLRPTNPDHLWYAFNVLDWPIGDNQAVMQDDDGQTFLNYDPTLTPSPNGNGDVKVIPVLEIILPKDGNNLPTQAELDEYQIKFNPLPDPEDGLVAYAPLQIVTDPDSGEQVAFYTKMLYKPDEEWGLAHHMRLVWVVQALVDVCAVDGYNDAGECITYAEYNKPTIIQSYPDDWYLTGLAVRENIETKTTTIYEDPTSDAGNLDNDDPLWGLAFSLDEVFLGARTVINNLGIKEREITTDSIYDRFNHSDTTSTSAERWGLPNIFTVVQDSYEHIDKAIFTQATQVNEQVLSVFDQATTPTLLFAREDVYRALNLNEWQRDLPQLFEEEGDQLTLDMDQTKVPESVLASLKWSPYVYDNGVWNEMPIVDYWEVLAQRHLAEFTNEYGPDAEGALFLAQLTYMSLHGGSVSIVEINDAVLTKGYYNADRPVAASLALLGRGVVLILVTRQAETFGKGLFPLLIMLRDYGGITRSSKLAAAILNPFDVLGQVARWATSSIAGAAFVMIAAAVLFLVVYSALVDDNLGARIALAVIVVIVGGALLIVKPILSIVNLGKAMVELGKATTLSEGIFKVLSGAENINRGLKAAAVAGLVISVGIALGIFIWAVTEGNLPPGSIAYNQLVAQLVASIIVAIIIMALSFSLIGTILIGLLTLIDLLLFALGSDFSITGAITEAIAKAIYKFQLTVEEPFVDMGAMELGFPGDGAKHGLVAGNPFELSMPITHYITHTLPTINGLDLYASAFFTKSDLRKTTFLNQLDLFEVALTASRGQISSEWGNFDKLSGSEFNFARNAAFKDSLFYSADYFQQPSIVLTPTGGINVSTPVYLNSAFALPGADCWWLVVAGYYCEDRTFKGNSSTDVGSSLVLDIFPATLDEFYAMDWGGNRPFPQQRDHDGDGLISRDFGGSDPSDSITDCNGGVCWDKDGDGLSDKKEVALQDNHYTNSPSIADEDKDGLCDAEEVRIGTNPQRRDSDGDGLTDGQEVWHYDCNTDSWGGGWTINLGNNTIIQVFSDPFNADMDGDGISDLEEKNLAGTLDDNGIHFHPSVTNDNPIKIRVELSDTIVGKNQPYTVTTTVDNQSSRWAYGVITTTIPTAVSANISGAITETMPNLNVGDYHEQVIPLISPASPNVQSAAITANAGAGGNDGSIEPTWEWLIGNNINNPTTTYAHGVSIVAVPNSGHQNRPSYSAATLEEANPSSKFTPIISPVLPANGINRSIAADNYNPSNGEINRDASTPQEYNSNLTTNTQPDVACNDAGQCLTVASSAYWYNCRSANLFSVQIIKENDTSGGSEFYIQRNGRDWNDAFNDANGDEIWRLPGDLRPSTVSPPSLIPFSWCEGDTIDLWEGDGNDYKEDDYFCSFYLSQGVPVNVFGAELLQFHCVSESGKNEVNINVAIDNPNAGSVSPQWQQHTSPYCATVTIESLNVKVVNDFDALTQNGVEYYIQTNGTNRGSKAELNGEGTTRWTYSSSVTTPGLVTVNASFSACRGMTIDVWEDDGLKDYGGAFQQPDDHICSIPVFGNDPADPTSGRLGFSTEQQGAQNLATLGWIDGQTECRTLNNSDRLDLNIKVTPRPQNVVTGGLFNATTGSPTYNGIVIGPENGNWYSGYDSYKNLAVASDGSDFLTVWTNNAGNLRVRRTNANGSLPQTQPATVAGLPTPVTDVDLAWVRSNRYLVAAEVNFKDVYIFYVNRDGVVQSTPQLIGLNTHNEYTPDLAFNPVTGEAMLTYVQRLSTSFQGTVIASIISNSGSSPTVANTDAVDSANSIQVPAVDYHAANDIWVVSWLESTTLKYRALKNNGQPFNASVLPIKTAVSNNNVPISFPNYNVSLACDQKAGENSECAVAYHDANALYLHTMRAVETKLNLGGFTPSASVQLVIDSQGPTSTLSLPDDRIISLTGPTINLHGEAKDLLSGVAQVGLTITRNGGGTETIVNVTTGPDAENFQDSWVHVWAPPQDGVYTIVVNLKDRVGNTSSETFSNVIVDSVLPTITSDSASNALLNATQDANGSWFVTLSGTAADSSGITAVLANTNQGDILASLSCTNNNTSCTWSVSYPLPAFDGSSGLTGPAEAYIASIQVIDGNDRLTELDIPFRVDEAAPVATLTSPAPYTANPVITSPQTLTGSIIDPGDVASGIQSLQIDLVEPATGITPTWQTALTDNATLASSGNGVTSTTWSYPLPADIEGNYEIILRGTDTQQNVNNNLGDWFSGWQGIIDTKAPVASVTITPRGQGRSLKYDITATVTDAFLTEDGWNFICDINNGDQTYALDTLSNKANLNGQLVGLDVSCQVKAQDITDPVVLDVFDAYGHQTSVTTPLTVVTAQTQVGITAVAANVIASTVLTPTNDSVLTTYDPATIEGGAYADNNLEELTLSVNGTDIYTESWSGQTVTDTLWSTSWTPTADGVYEFISIATDQSNGTQTDLQPVTITVDTQAPTVVFDTTVLTQTHQLAKGIVVLTGTLSDNLNLNSVMISINGGPAEPVAFDSSSWRYVWVVDEADDGTTYSVDITASDGGNVTTVNETVTVDLLPPAEIIPTLSATDGNTSTVLAEGDTVRDPAATTLVLDWPASSDGSGIDRYAADWSQSLTPALGTPSSALSHEEMGGDATAWLAHLQVVDGVGNSTLQTEGPIYLDAPTTPDYINPDDGLTTNIYRGWMDSGCSQIGVNYEIFRNALDGESLTAVQEMYLTWDAANLRMAWVGANWNIDGDLSIYLDTASGGATDAYDPYGSAHTIALPAQGSNQLAANYVIHIEDGTTAVLLSWNGSSWANPQALGAPNYFYNEGITDLYLPLSMLGNPTAMKMVALASDEDALRLWATAPDKNPLNSEQVASSAALPFLDTSFSLQQQLEWTNVGASGVCPSAGQFENSDLNTSLTASIQGSQVGYLAQDLPGLLQSNGVPKVQLDSDNNGIADLNEDSNASTYLPLDTDPSPIGPGGSATYTLRITNDGTAPATGVQVDLAAYGAMSLASSTTNPVSVGTIAAGAFAEVTFTVEVATSTTIDGGEVTAVVSDNIHGAFDWLWVLYDIDHEGPDPTLISGPKYINPDISQIFGTVSDASDVPTIILRKVGTTTEVTCTDSSPADGEWICSWDASSETGATLQLEAKAVDEWGNAGPYGSPPFTFILDDVPPTITLDAASTAALSDGLLLDGELFVRGVVSDNNLPAYAELCAQEASATEPTCTTIAVNPSNGNWAGNVPVDLGADNKTYTLTFTGIDAAGNRSQTPLTYSNVVVDTAGPAIDVTTYVQNPIQFSNVTALAGTVTDGSDVATMKLWISKLDGSESLDFDNIRSGQNWSYNRTFTRPGQYSVSLEATDTHGNITRVGPLPLTVLLSTANLPPTIGLGAGFTVNEGSTIVLDANASDPNGDTLTIDWDLDNNGSYETTGATATFDATGIDATSTPQAFTVKVRVSDGGNSPVVASTVVSVVNASPVLSNLVATAVTENGTTTLTGTITDPAAADSFTLDVDWGDGTTAETVNLAAGATSFSLTHQYVDDNPSGTPLDNVLINLTITDDDGGSSQATTTVAVSNSAPTLSNVSATAIDEDGTTTVSGTIADVGTLDSFTLLVDWGDGSNPETFDYGVGVTIFSETHQYLDDNPSGTAVDDMIITLTIKDDDLSESESTTTVTISNLAPSLSNVAINDVDENGVATLTGSISDVGEEDSFTLDVDWGDSSPVSTYSYPAGTAVFTETHQFIDDNPSGTASDPYTVSLTLTDDDTGSDTDSTTVTVTNLNPTLSNVAITDVDENGVATLTGNLADVGTQDSFTLVVDWGDGTAVESFIYAAGTTSFSQTHRYLDDNPSGTASDPYTVSLTLTDDDTGSDTDSTTVKVTNLNPTLSNVTITDVDENGVATLSGNMADVGAQDSFTLEVDWGDGSAVDTYAYAAGTTSLSETHRYLDDNPTDTAFDSYTVSLTLTDDDTGSDTDSTTVKVTNLKPTLSNVAITDVNEDGVATLTGNMADVGTQDSFTLEVDWGDGSPVLSYMYAAGTTTFTRTHRYLDDKPSGTASDPYTVSLTLTDDDTGNTTDSTIVTVSNVAPVLSTDVPTQTVQYSDSIADVTITGTDVADDPLQASTSWSVDGGASVSGLPAGLSVATNSCSIGGNGRTCSWTLSGIADVIAGSYTIRVTVEDDDLGQTSIDQIIEVVPEDAWVRFDPDNPVAVLVDDPGSDSSLPFSLQVYVQESPESGIDTAPGDINLAEVSITLEPVGPGPSTTVQCDTVGSSVAANDYEAILTVDCDFSGIPVNTYVVATTVAGGYYTGYGEDVLVVFDPSLGFTTGGGWFYWSGSEDAGTGYPGDRTNFGYTMSYNKKGTNVKGNLLMIRHLPDSDEIYRIKSNALFGLALGEAEDVLTGESYGWASFSGKTTYLEPGMLEPEGNYEFKAYVEDWNEPGTGIDRFWIEVLDKNDEIKTDLSMPRPATDNTVLLSGGNVMVPHNGAQ